MVTQPDSYTVEARRRSAAEHNKDGSMPLLGARILAGEYDDSADQRVLAATLRELNWQPPVDPDLLEARKAASCGESDCVKRGYLSGQYDGGTLVGIALAAIKRGRELERGA